jgi:hypothetical protein
MHEKILHVAEQACALDVVWYDVEGIDNKYSQRVGYRTRVLFDSVTVFAKKMKRRASLSCVNTEQ